MTIAIDARACVLTVCLGVVALGCASQTPEPSSPEDASVRLRPVTMPLPETAVRHTVYVPVYSSIYLGLDIRQRMVDLTATVSVRNVSARQPLVLNSARYYDSAGKQIREYVSEPSELAALATVEFVVHRNDTAGGPGANFLIEWTAASGTDEPLIEAVMIGQSANAGFSFTSAGRTLKNTVPE